MSPEAINSAATPISKAAGDIPPVIGSAVAVALAAVALAVALAVSLAVAVVGLEVAEGVAGAVAGAVAVAVAVGGDSGGDSEGDSGGSVIGEVSSSVVIVGRVPSAAVVGRAPSAVIEGGVRSLCVPGRPLLSSNNLSSHCTPAAMAVIKATSAPITNAACNNSKRRLATGSSLSGRPSRGYATGRREGSYRTPRCGSGSGLDAT